MSETLSGLNSENQGYVVYIVHKTSLNSAGTVI